MEKNNMKIYCRFDKTKPSVDKVICKMFCDYTENKKNEKENLQNGKNKKSTLK